MQMKRQMKNKKKHCVYDDEIVLCCGLIFYKGHPSFCYGFT
jgi:hypothetical protein